MVDQASSSDKNNPAVALPPLATSSHLLQIIKALFSEEELRDICFELSVVYEDLPALGRSGKARELISHLERRNRLQPLWQLLQAMRPSVPWNDPAFWTEFEEKPTATPGQPPFKGLTFFDEPDAPLFFGRERLIGELVNHLAKHPFLAVIGASGSGKSSLVRAGVIPALKGDTALEPEAKRSSASPNLPPDSTWAPNSAWAYHTINPTDQPLKSLATSLTRDAVSLLATTTLIDDLAQDPRSLDLFVQKQRAENPDYRLVLVVDQFEETFTLCRDENQRRAFIENLMTAVSPTTGGATTVIIALRADFYARCGSYPALRTQVQDHQKYIGPMSAEELRRAIEQPPSPIGPSNPALLTCSSAMSARSRAVYPCSPMPSWKHGIAARATSSPSPATSRLAASSRLSLRLVKPNSTA